MAVSLFPPGAGLKNKKKEYQGVSKTIFTACQFDEISVSSSGVPHC